MITCAFCFMDINENKKEDIWYEVAGWVHGEKKDSLSLRSYTGNHAHSSCIGLAKEGHKVNEADIFTGPEGVVIEESGGIDPEIEELLDDNRGE